MKKVETLVTMFWAGSDVKRRVRILAGDQTEAVNKSPSWDDGRGTRYCTGRIITAAMRKTKWYQEARFDDAGNAEL